MSKNKLLNIKDKIEGNEVDLSLCNLTEVPVRELAAVSKVTVVDLSCNNLSMLTPDFCGLVHLVKLDLNKNHLESLPEDFGNLVNLQHLDLLGNRLTELPVSFSQLRSLKWLDLKDNPLEAGLAKAAGDCLDERQCKQCAARVLQHMRGLQEEVEKIRQKKLQREKDLERKREAKQREREAREKEVKKREKAEEKERRRAEYQQQVAAQAAQEQQKKKQEEKKKKNGKAPADKKASSDVPVKPRRSVLRLLLKLLLVALVGLASTAAACVLTELRELPACRHLGLLLHHSLTWATEQKVLLQDLLLNLSSSAKELLESTQQQLTDKN
ncbi:leucine-rich repeat-containing protein 59 isoform X1 [Boleophthalmus pectinirostris]|uniref:leucine-rich repeat-containing protein 59 isoform X1 n=1 Tax=Boleophthalmus pectinirostris TaxID=150288 RepID=UPI0024331004|nr:leucine-rich repeat-containing protein 59 isoform X1 [Boleophthalmus pectinirostris]